MDCIRFVWKVWESLEGSKKSGGVRRSTLRAPAREKGRARKYRPFVKPFATRPLRRRGSYGSAPALPAALSPRRIAKNWSLVGISLGGPRGFYGGKMGYKRNSHMSEIKFAHVRLTFCTCANYKSHVCEFLFHEKANPIAPSRRPKKIQGQNQFHPIIKLKRSSQ